MTALRPIPRGTDFDVAANPFHEARQIKGWEVIAWRDQLASSRWHYLDGWTVGSLHDAREAGRIETMMARIPNSCTFALYLRRVP